MVDVRGGHKPKFPGLTGWGVSEVESRLPRKGCKGSRKDAVMGRGICSVEVVNKLLAVSKVDSGFLAVMARVVAFPFDKILVLVAILTAVKDAFNFIFKFIIDLNGFWWGWCLSIDFISTLGGEVVNMEDGVPVHAGWEE